MEFEDVWWPAHRQAYHERLFDEVRELIWLTPRTLFRRKLWIVALSVLERVNELEGTSVFWLLNVLQVCAYRRVDTNMVATIMIHLSHLRHQTMKPLLLRCLTEDYFFLDYSSRKYKIFPYIMKCLRCHRVEMQDDVRYTKIFALNLIDWNNIHEQGRNFIQLLQYGGGLDTPSEVFQEAVRNLLRCLITECKGSGEWDDSLVRNVPSNSENQRVKNLSAWFRLLVEESSDPRYRTSLEMVLSSTRGIDARLLSREGDNLVAFYNSLYPGKRYGHREPASLQHLAKITVRRALLNSHQLPFGIAALPLPRVIKKILSLKNPFKN